MSIATANRPLGRFFLCGMHSAVSPVTQIQLDVDRARQIHAL